jgi:hypothetical protein
MFGLGWSKSPSGPRFVIGQPSVFSKQQLAPIEFGQEIVRLGLNFGIEKFEHHQTSCNISPEDARLLKEVESNPGLLQLLYMNLSIGANLCYAKVILQVPDEIMAEVGSGVLSGLRSTIPGMDETLIEDQKNIAANFSTAIGRELQQIEENASLFLFYRYVNHFYPEGDTSGGTTVPRGLYNSLTGLGTRLMAMECQNFLKITYVNAK